MHAKTRKLAKSTRRVPVVKLAAQNLEGEVKTRRARISSLDCSRDMDKNVISDGI